MSATKGEISEANWEDLFTFARTLNAADVFGGNADNVLYFFEKPWKWEREYATWVQMGQPLDGDGAVWDQFVAYLDERR